MDLNISTTQAARLNYWRIDDGDRYLHQVASKILLLRNQNPEQDFWVLTPNYFSIELLKEELFLINQTGQCASQSLDSCAIILPRITTAENYILEQLLEAPKEGRYSNYEEIAIMSKIIMQYPGRLYKTGESIEIASEFVLLFSNIRKNFIDINSIDEWVHKDLAAHWLYTADFLKYAFKEFEKQIGAVNIEYNIESIKHFKKRYLVLVGLTENFNFFSNYLTNTKSSHLIILPPLIEYNLHEQKGAMDYLLNYYNHNIIMPKTTLNDINSNIQESSATKSNARLYEFYDIYEEANFIADYAREVSSCGRRIIIVSSNYFFEEVLVSRLSSKISKLCSSFGRTYSNLEEASMFQLLARMKYEKGSKESFIAFITSSIILKNQSIQDLLIHLNKSNKLYDSVESIYKYNITEVQRLNLQEFFESLQEFLESKETMLIDLLTSTYESFKKIYSILELKSLYSKAERFRNFIEDLISLKELNFEISYEDFAIYAQNIFSLKAIMPFDKDAKIFILKYDDSLLIDADEVIFADFNQESIIKNEGRDGWLARKIFDKILGESGRANYHKILYQVSSKIYSNNPNRNVIFSRALFKDSTLTEKCAILDLIDHDVITKENRISKESISIIPAPNLEVARLDLPQKLYATNIELLARNPYGFFAKKILGLGRKKNILSSVEASDFGSIIHEHIEHISLHQDKTYEEIFEAICETRGLSSFYRELWKAPSIKIGKEISSSNNKVKQQTGTYFTEIEGGIYCEISGNISIELRAIADRIEVFEDKIRIIDYKTGSPPSKADVYSGKSPQLMIEAIIYFYNGFAPGIIFDESKSIELVFSKVSTKNPYLQEKIIPISFNDIEKHYTHMKSLLEFYYTEESSYFGNENIPDSWAPKYDDYAYLGRRIT